MRRCVLPVAIDFSRTTDACHTPVDFLFSTMFIHLVLFGGSYQETPVVLLWLLFVFVRFFFENIDRHERQRELERHQ